MLHWSRAFGGISAVAGNTLPTNVRKAAGNPTIYRIINMPVLIYGDDVRFLSRGDGFNAAHNPRAGVPAVILARVDEAVGATSVAEVSCH